MKDAISVVIPVHNEVENIAPLVQRVTAACRACGHPWEVVLIDDGSTDGSTERLEVAAREHEGHVRIIVLNRNYGQHSAIMCGFGHVRGEIIITLDADLQNPPEEIGRLIEEIENGNDVVGSIRKHRQDSIFRRMASRLITWMVQKSTGVPMTDFGCMLRAYRRPIVEAMLLCRERSTFIPVLANSFAKTATEIEVGHAERVAGESKYSVWRLMNLQFDLLTSMTTTPLRLLSWVGAIIALGGVTFGVLLLVLRLVLGQAWAAEGVFTLFAILFIFVGAQFVAMGLLGEYLGRVYHDVRGRPRFFIDHIAGHTDLDSPPVAETVQPVERERQVQV